MKIYILNLIQRFSFKNFHVVKIINLKYENILKTEKPYFSFDTKVTSNTTLCCNFKPLVAKKNPYIIWTQFYMKLIFQKRHTKSRPPAETQWRPQCQIKELTLCHVFLMTDEEDEPRYVQLTGQHKGAIRFIRKVINSACAHNSPSRNQHTRWTNKMNGT